MNRFNLTQRVVSGCACVALAAVGFFQSSGHDVLVIRDGHAPRMSATATQHLDEIKMTNPILDEVKMTNPILSSLEL